MPSIDLPLEELKTYMGSSPRPDDFDAFWDAALAEMRAIDPAVTLTEAPLAVNNFDLFDMYFTGVDHARIHVKHIRPKDLSKKVPAVLWFHGYTGDAGDFAGHLWLASQGFAVYALDCRGQGGKSEDVGGLPGNTLSGHFIRGLVGYDPNQMFIKRLFLDTAQLAGIAMDTDYIDETRVYCHGYSQGGGLCWACAALEPRVAKLAPIYPFFSDYRRIYQLDAAPGAFEEFKIYFRMFDPRHDKEEQAFHTLGYFDAQYLAERIRGQVQLTVGLMDNIVPPSIQFAVYNRITAHKELVLYPDFGHEGLPGLSDSVLAFLLR